jgi:hypothetical protein
MKDKVVEALNNVTDEARFRAFLRLLAEDRQEEKAHEVEHGQKKWSEGINGWQTADLADYLFSAHSWAESSKNGLPLYKKPDNSWKRVADILLAGKIYE